eukprot:TRINITY_DN6973_c0_g1_i5.p1 TRINITY_DN6973_c0_g1~~TRINITY_DN6973_c0_g1_i5.p1  ORF type:complete len:300 (+),score=49.34 TRINITY_DN6973_c0_g1_i5:914-1813(+)
MVGTDAIIGGLDTGIKEYALKGRHIADFVEEDIGVSNTSSFVENTVTTILFSKEYNKGNNPMSKSIASPIIFAIGKTPQLKRHKAITNLPIFVNFATGEASVSLSLPLIHGVLMYLIWCLVLPVGVLSHFAKGFRCLSSSNAHIMHAVIQSIGFIMMLFGAGIGIKIAADILQHPYHGVFGLITLTITLFQVLAGTFPFCTSKSSIPPKVLKARKIISVLHGIIGKLLFPFAWLTIFTGLAVLNLPQTYLFVHGGIVVTWLAIYVGLHLFLKHTNTKLPTEEEHIDDNDNFPLDTEFSE